MAFRRARSLFNNSNAVSKLHFSTSTSINNKWRYMKGLEPNPNRYGPLKLLPDFSYVDGRPAPLSWSKIREMERQKTLCQKIAELSNELDVGLKQHYEYLERKKKAKAAIIQNKLKPKGAALLKKNKEDLE